MAADQLLARAMADFDENSALHAQWPRGCSPLPRNVRAGRARDEFVHKGGMTFCYGFWTSIGNKTTTELQEYNCELHHQASTTLVCR